MESLVAHVARKWRADVRVVQVDVEDRAELAARLGVADAPALVLVVGRRVRARLEGRASAPAIEALLAAA
jgi:thioredoxin-like negative regulator of GroEL